MIGQSQDRPAAGRRAVLVALGASGAAVLAAGLAGGLTAAWGYGLFAAAASLLGAAAVCFGIFAFSRAGDTALLRRALTALLWSGIGAYALALCAFAGFFTREAFEGRMELRWILFGPAVLVALLVLDSGLYRKLVKNNLPTWRRYGKFISREQADPAAMRRTLVDEVIVHRSLFEASKIRWLRHTLIFWGFAWMVAFELAAVFLREGFPAFGWRDVWREPGNPVRLVFDAAFDLTGLMVMAGCAIALAWRVRVNGTPEQKFSDTPTTLFLLFVVASGFVVEGLRIAASLGDPAHAASFVGVAFARGLLGAGMAREAAYQPLWLVHVIGACAFIAYVPVKRLVHTCATPMGRLMNSQKGLLLARKQRILGAMLRGGARTDAVVVAPGAVESPRG